MSSGIKIGDLAARAGLKPSAIRYYEAEGILPAPGRKNGRRVYGSDDLVRLKLIMLARQMGFSISQLRGMAKLETAELKPEAREHAGRLRTSIAKLLRVANEMEELSQCPCDDAFACTAIAARQKKLTL